MTNKIGQQQKVPVPCGKCPACTARRTSAWSFRLMQEEKRCKTAYFVTLTYATEHVPITPSGYLTVNKADCQEFMKRLRYYNEDKLRYFLAAEYGSTTFRPHYHLILFNAQIETIQKAWTSGEVHYGQVTGASIGYTLKYINKGKMIPMHKKDDRIPEFQLMSKQLGNNYLTKKMIQYHKNDLENRAHLVLEDGKKIAMPRYYKDKIYDEMERKRIAYFNNPKHEDQLYEKLLNNNYWAMLYEAQEHKKNVNKINSSKNEKL